MFDLLQKFDKKKTSTTSSMNWLCTKAVAREQVELRSLARFGVLRYRISAKLEASWRRTGSGCCFARFF